MTLHGDIMSVLPFLRSEASGRMTETVRIGNLDESEDELLNPIQVLVPVYTGGARIKFTATGAGVRDVEAGGQLVAEQRPEVHLPSGTSGVVTDMFGIVDASSADPAIVGLTFRIEGVAEMGQTTAARFPIRVTGETFEEDS